MVLKPTESEQGAYSGCLISAIIGSIAGTLAGQYFMSSMLQGLPPEMPAKDIMGAIIGGVAGLFLGGIFSLILSAFSSKTEKEKDEF